jgi:inorganic pyrophosphatase
MDTYRLHPWHGVGIGAQAPRVLTTFIEIVPTDTVKYEIDKHSGILKVDRPQLYSNVCPTLYGFVPQTYCAERVGAFCDLRTGRKGIQGDGDPVDICVLTEKSFSHGDMLLESIPIGGLRMIDKSQADDKIIAVLKGDAVYGRIDNIDGLPSTLIDRLRHYFLTYKQSPDKSEHIVEITDVYGRADALEVIRRSYADYYEHYEGKARQMAPELSVV